MMPWMILKPVIEKDTLLKWKRIRYIGPLVNMHRSKNEKRSAHHGTKTKFISKTDLTRKAYQSERSHFRI